VLGTPINDISTTVFEFANRFDYEYYRLSLQMSTLRCSYKLARNSD